MLDVYSFVDNPAFAVNTLLVEVASMVFLNAIVSVDTFFVVSALLFSYLTLKYFRRHQPNVKQFLKLIPGFYSHRYIRLVLAQLTGTIYSSYVRTTKAFI